MRQILPSRTNRFRQNFLSTVGNAAILALYRNKPQVWQRICAFSAPESKRRLERIVEPDAWLLLVNLQRERSRVKRDMRRFPCSLPRERLARPCKLYGNDKIVRE